MGSDYHPFFQNIVRVRHIKDVKEINEYRNMLDSLNNEDYDTGLSIIGVPVLKHMLYNNLIL